LVLYFALNSLLKLPFDKSFLENGSFLSLLVLAPGDFGHSESGNFGQFQSTDFGQRISFSCSAVILFR
ncbi:MAG: hypothetical protein II568_08300, partial [Erysipelotrichaceae bacterium]|nr:hypothetical protein [Erysipelotrichaceae bacterium]